MTWARALVAGMHLLRTGCASISPEANLRDDLSVDLYWDARRECEGRYRTLHLVRACYRQGVRKRADLRRQKGQSLPDGLNLQPAVELD
jgi:hypothetical protein